MPIFCSLDRATKLSLLRYLELMLLNRRHHPRIDIEFQTAGAIIFQMVINWVLVS